MSVSLEEISPARRSFEIGVAYALGSVGLGALSRWQPDELQTLIEATLGVKARAGSNTAVAEYSVALRDGVAARLAGIATEVSLVRSQLNKWALADVAREVKFAAERMATFVCGSIESALPARDHRLTTLAENHRLHRLARWATSEAYLEGRRRYGLVPGP